MHRMLFAVFTLTFLLGAMCRPPEYPAAREAARGALLTASEAVRIADVECARVVRATGNRPLGELCDERYTMARAVLITAASAVDVWERVEARRTVTCAVIDATASVQGIMAAVKAAGGRELPIVDDAVALAQALGRCSR
jgi:hypothetical protein